MSKERLHLFDTTLSRPFARSREAREHEQTKESRRAGQGYASHE